jgi:8-oxo-dGTP diphosphatase
MDRPQKVVAYVVRDGRILVFRHADHDTLDLAGIQVPAGTLRPGEPIEDAVLREAYEETGLTGLRIERYLGAAEYDMRPSADAIHVRHYFHLSLGAARVPQRWHAFERGDGDAEPIRFELYWLPLAQAHVVGGGQAALVGRLVAGS